MSNEDVKALLRRWTDAWNEHDPDSAAALLKENYVRHDTNGPDVIGPAGAKMFLRGIFDAFPDLRLEVTALIAENHLVAVRYTVTGTHTGEFNGIPPSGRNVDFQAHDWFSVDDGKISEQWVIIDVLGLLQQIGAIPPTN